MAKPAKVSAVAELSDRFRASSAAVVTEYRGLSMSQLTTLRRALGADAAYTVAKNTLAKRAAHDAGLPGLDDLFVGPSAIAFVTGEPVEAAKALRDFAKDNKALVIRGGCMDGRVLSAADIAAIADLDSREALLARLAAAMSGNLAKAAALFGTPASQLVRLVDALREKNEPGGPGGLATTARD